LFVAAALAPQPIPGGFMSNNTQYVADRIELMDVMLKYAKGVDERDMALYRSVFADDVEVVGFGRDVYRGIAAWATFVETALAQYGPTQHMLGPQLATVQGDTAHCRTDVQALHYLKDKPNTTLTLWATYVTDMKRIGGAWKIARHELISRGTRVQAG
jgi:ketosteroid isomerase-like protein